MSDDSANPYQAPAMIDDPSVVGSAGANPLLDGRLATVGLGLKLIYWGLVLLLLSWICVVPMGMVLVMFESTTFHEYAIQWTYIGLLLLAVGLVNLGPFLCLSVPGGYGLRPFAIATAISIAFFWLALLLETTVLGYPFLWTGSMFFAIPLVGSLFLAFLYRLSQALGRSDLKRRCKLVFFVGAIEFLLGLARLSGPGITPIANNLWFIWGIAILLMALLLFIAYANVVNAIANAIRRPTVQPRSAAIL